jgi:two-component system, NarL family, sensor kinase
VPSRSGESTAALILLEQGLAARLRRLEGAELRLRRMVARARRAAGRAALRQVERERQRLGAELHTGVGQLLAAIRIQVELIELQLPSRAPSVGQALDRIGALAADALAQVRALSRGLYKPEWHSMPLDVALWELWERSGMAQRFAGGVRIAPLAVEPDLETKCLLYRAAQEALSNVMRHAKATRVDVSLEQDGANLCLVVADDGSGFDPSLPQPGIGLCGIREQAAAVAGKLLIESGATGTKLKLSVPLSC